MTTMDDSSAATVPILYSFRRCPYAMRARMALLASKVNYVMREVALQNKPKEMLDASPKGTVPVLVLPNERVIDESLDIVHWALTQQYPQQWLATDHPTMDAMMSLVEINDGAFKFHLDRMKYANRYPGTKSSEHRAEAVKLLVPLDERLRDSNYLFGNAPALADIAIFPFVRQFAHADKTAFAALQLPHLQKWLAEWEASALFESAMIKHPVWQADPDRRYGHAHV